MMMEMKMANRTLKWAVHRSNCEQKCQKKIVKLAKAGDGEAGGSLANERKVSGGLSPENWRSLATAGIGFLSILALTNVAFI